MIKWFKRKKKKGQEEEPEDLRQTETGEVEGQEEEEEVPAEKTLAAAEVFEPEAENELEPESFAPVDEQAAPSLVGERPGVSPAEPLPPEEETWEEEQVVADEVSEEGVPKKRGFFRRLRKRFKQTETEEVGEPEEEEGGPGEETLDTAESFGQEAVDELEPEPEPFAPVEEKAPVSGAGGWDAEPASFEEEAWEEEEEIVEEVSEEGVPRKRGLFRRLRQRLKGTREKFVHRIDKLVLGKRVIDEDLLDELEEILITSDLGVRTTGMLLRKVADKVKRKELSDPAKLREQIREEIRSVLSVEAPPLDYTTHKPFVVMIVGVNGTGKTTTTGKLANQLKQEGLKPMLVACDTFRAAAVEQLSIWGERNGVPVVKQKSGSDPSAVAFDSLDAAISREIDVVLMDTAGRMHTKVNLMEELKKIHRVVGKKMPDAPHEVFLVLDASTGQNALSQAKLFKEGIGLTGLILTKLDGTAKGGIIAAICDELQVPVRYIGIGESIDDLRPFDAEEFTNALF